MLGKLNRMPVPVAVCILALCILAGTALGNRNALVEAKAASEEALVEVTVPAKARAVEAGNLRILAQRVSPDDPAVPLLAEAIAAIEAARRPAEITEANRALTAACEAVRQAITGKGTAQDEKLLTGLMDNIDSAENMIALRVREYNAALLGAQSVYDALPTRWIQAAPEMF